MRSCYARSLVSRRYGGRERVLPYSAFRAPRVYCQFRMKGYFRFLTFIFFEVLDFLNDFFEEGVLSTQNIVFG